MTVIEVKVYFDTICAWCYIGHRTLFHAISLFQKTYPNASFDTFNITFSPFYRDRTLPDQAVPLEGRLASSLGEDKHQDIRTRVQRIGRSHGININLHSLIGNTQSSHRLIYHAGTVGSEKQRALIEQIYFKWFEEGGDITSHEFLLDCAKEAGLNTSKAAYVLENGAYAKHVDALDTKAREEHITCVPTFIIDGTKIEGAEDVGAFYEAFVKAKEKGGSEISDTNSAKP